MGVYLSEPNKEKKISEGSITGLSYVSAEMQGNLREIQVGAKVWKTQPSTFLTLETATDSLQSLMDMEV